MQYILGKNLMRQIGNSKEKKWDHWLMPESGAQDSRNMHHWPISHSSFNHDININIEMEDRIEDTQSKRLKVSVQRLGAYNGRSGAYARRSGDWVPMYEHQVAMQAEWVDLLWRWLHHLKYEHLYFCTWGGCRMHQGSSDRVPVILVREGSHYLHH